jgi:transposase
MLFRERVPRLFYLLEFEQNVRNVALLHILYIVKETKGKGDFHFFMFIFKTVDMKRIVKQCVGIDVAHKELVVCLGRMDENWTPELYSNKVFSNTAKGFEQLTAWVGKQTEAQPCVRYVMEATGVYHEPLAYFLDAQAMEVSIVMPTKISNYMRTLDINTVTDKTSSQAIARFGLERNLELWVKPKEVYRGMRQLTRERDQIVAERSMLTNFRHAEENEAYPNAGSLARIDERVVLLDKQEKEIKKEIAVLVTKDGEVKAALDRITSIPGIGALTAAVILAETNGFELIRNKRQLASYAGFDVKDKQSGTSVKGKPQISKKGNRYLRKAMHMPALTAKKHDERFRAIYARLVSKHGIKMKAAVAIQRKLLEMAYTVYKTGKDYDSNYLKETKAKDDIALT